MAAKLGLYRKDKLGQGAEEGVVPGLERIRAGKN